MSVLNFDEERLKAMCSLFDEAEAALQAGHPEFCCAFLTFARLIGYENPEQVFKEELAIAKASGVDEIEFKQAMSYIAIIHRTIGPFEFSPLK